MAQFCARGDGRGQGVHWVVPLVWGRWWWWAGVSRVVTATIPVVCRSSRAPQHTLQALEAHKTQGGRGKTVIYKLSQWRWSEMPPKHIQGYATGVMAQPGCAGAQSMRKQVLGREG